MNKARSIVSFLSANRKLIAGGMLGLLLTLGLPLLFMLLFMFQLGFLSRMPQGNERRFDRMVWLQQTKTARTDIRWQMLDDLQKNYLKPDMTVEDMTALLGKPEYKYRRDDNTTIIQYEISNVMMDSCYLTFPLDSTNSRISDVGYITCS